VVLQFSLDSNHLSKNLLLRVNREKDHNDWIPVYLSEVKKHKNWEEFQISVDTLCRGEPERNIIIEVLKYSKRSANKRVGICETTLGEIQH
jgi:hypothetical protein